MGYSRLPHELKDVPMTILKEFREYDAIRAREIKQAQK